MSLPNPQIMADAQALSIFSQAVSQAAAKFVNLPETESPEVEKLRDYCRDNLISLKSIVERLEVQFA